MIFISPVILPFCSVKSLNLRATNANRATKWANIHVYVAKLAIATLMSNARVSNTRRMHQFHVPSAITKHKKQKN